MSVICPYCRKPAKFMESSALIYHGRNYGPVYACMPCGAWVGCHPNTTRPLGRLANAELREMKMKTHAAFDPIWTARFERKHAIDPRYKKAMARGGRYKKLAELLEIPREQCHIGMFDVDLCRRTIEICAAGALEDA